MEKVKVYLSGGFHSNWADRVIAACDPEQFLFLNPLEKEKDPATNAWKNLPLAEEEKEARSKAQTQSPWWPCDKLAVAKADVIFCYMEDYRPKLLGTGAIFELGMAYAFGKLVILVNRVEHRYYREFEHVFTSFKSLDEGIEFLKKCSWLKG
jgi:nucleoside 2-deoxyribosyltransferase